MLKIHGIYICRYDLSRDPKIIVATGKFAKSAGLHVSFKVQTLRPSVGHGDDGIEIRADWSDIGISCPSTAFCRSPLRLALRLCSLSVSWAAFPGATCFTFTTGTCQHEHLLAVAKQHLNLNNIQISFFAVSSERQRRWNLWNQNFPQEMQWGLKQYRSLSHWVTDTFCSANIAIFAEILTPSKWSLCSHTPTRWGGAGDKARMELLAKLEVATKSGSLGKVSRVGHGCSSINSFKYNSMENNIDKSWIVIFAGRVGTLLSCNCVTKMQAHFESLGPCLSLSVLQSPCMFWEDLFLSLFVWHLLTVEWLS